MRSVFMGSPDFAVPSLAATHGASELVGVVTQPDRRAGRGRKLAPNPVKRWSQTHHVEVYQPESVNTPEALAWLHSLQPDAIIVAAFGQILRPPVLALPPLGCINIHASLLPRWRGAAPIQAAILAGDAQTGVTLMQMDRGMDTGPILAQIIVNIAPGDTGGSLSERLSQVGGELLAERLDDYAAGRLQPSAQDNSQATYAPMLKKSDGRLDFTKPAEELARQVRAYEPWPGSFLFWRDSRIVVRRAHAETSDLARNIGTVAESGARSPKIQTSDGWLVLDRVQPAGKPEMAGEAFLNGSRDLLGEQLVPISP
jgi:methionyl-tRNA formyltransferase